MCFHCFFRCFSMFFNVFSKCFKVYQCFSMFFRCFSMVFRCFSLFFYPVPQNCCPGPQNCCPDEQNCWTGIPGPLKSIENRFLSSWLRLGAPESCWDCLAAFGDTWNRFKVVPHLLSGPTELVSGPTELLSGPAELLVWAPQASKPSCKSVFSIPGCFWELLRAAGSAWQRLGTPGIGSRCFHNCYPDPQNCCPGPQTCCLGPQWGSWVGVLTIEWGSWYQNQMVPSNTDVKIRYKIRFKIRFKIELRKQVQIQIQNQKTKVEANWN